MNLNPTVTGLPIAIRAAQGVRLANVFATVTAG